MAKFWITEVANYCRQRRAMHVSLESLFFLNAPKASAPNDNWLLLIPDYYLFLPAAKDDAARVIDPNVLSLGQ